MRRNRHRRVGLFVLPQSARLLPQFTPLVAPVPPYICYEPNTNTAMATMIFVNLPVKDLNRSITFFTALGYTFSPEFSNEQGTCMVVSDTIYVMLLVEDFFRTFTNNELVDATRNTEVILCLSANNRAHVDELVDKAIGAGASSPKEPLQTPCMYGRSFSDLDGHHWEVMYMDPDAVEPTEHVKEAAMT